MYGYRTVKFAVERRMLKVTDSNASAMVGWCDGQSTRMAVPKMLHGAQTRLLW